MATTDFLPFGIATGANVLSQAAYAALQAEGTGFQSGTASSAQVNKVLRQATVLASALTQLVADTNSQNVYDDGNVPNLEAQIKAAFLMLVKGTTYFAKSQILPPDIPYDPNAPADYEVGPTGSQIGNIVVPGGYSNFRLDATAYVAGNTTSDTNVYLAIFYQAAGGPGWTFLESQITYKPAGKYCCLSRTAFAQNLDPTKSYTFVAHMLKDSQTGAPTPPSGNLLLEAHQ